MPAAESVALPTSGLSMRSIVTRVLVPAVVGALLLPIVIVVALGLAGLLAALGDDVGAAVCRGSALAVAVGWVVSVVTTAVAAGIVAVDAAGRIPPAAENADPPPRRAED